MSGRPTTRLLVIIILAVAACAGMDSRVQTTADGVEDRLAAALEDAVRREGIPAASVAVRFADGSGWTGAAGVTGGQDPRPVRPSTPFRVASVTKTYLAALAHLLADEGVLDLDEPVTLSGVPEGATLRHLLSHTSGLPHDYPLRPVAWDEEKLAALGARAVCDPGTCIEYSDLGFIAAGVLIEGATGRTIDDLFRERIFEPNGLDETWFGDSRLPEGTARSHTGDGRERGAFFEVAFGPGTWTAGAMVTSAPDLLAWGEALFGGRVVSTQHLREMTDGRTTRDLPCGDHCPGPYGLGVGLGRAHGRRAFGHGGVTGAQLVHLPEEHLTVAVLTSRTAGEGPLVDAILDATGVADRRDIYVVDVPGGTPRRLTTNPAVDDAPRFSPDGAHVVFASTRDGNSELYVMHADGSGERRLTDHPGNDVMGQLTADGRRVVLTSDRAGDLDVWSMTVDGTDVRRLTPAGSDEGWGTPSPDGRHLVIEHPGTRHVAVARADGAELRVLDIPGEQVHPSWSPTGDRIVYVEPGRGIRTARRDGSDVVVVSTDGGDRFPAWGASGRIAFVHGDDLWTMLVDGTHRRPVTRTDEREHSPAWSPDGSRLVFSSDRS